TVSCWIRAEERVRRKPAGSSAGSRSAKPLMPAAGKSPSVPEKKATRNYHPAKYQKLTRVARKSPRSALLLPRDRDTVDIRLDGRTVHLTNLRKLFWPDLGTTKGDLCQFYIDVADVLLPHLAHRA